MKTRGNIFMGTINFEIQVERLDRFIDRLRLKTKLAASQGKSYSACLNHIRQQPFVCFLQQIFDDQLEDSTLEI